MLVFTYYYMTSTTFYFKAEQGLIEIKMNKETYMTSL